MNFPKCLKPDASISTTTTSTSTSSTSTSTTSIPPIIPKQESLLDILSSRRMEGTFEVLLVILLTVGFIVVLYTSVDPRACRLKGEELQVPYHWTFFEGCKLEVEEGCWIESSKLTTWLLKKIKLTSP